MFIPSTPAILPHPTPKHELGSRDGNPSIAAKIGSAIARWSRRRSDQPEAAIDIFADIVAGSEKSARIDEALITLARRIAGPAVREVVLDREGPARHLRGPAREGMSRAVDFPLRYRGRDLGSLGVVLDAPHQLSPELRRRLTTLAMFAALAELADEAPRAKETSALPAPQPAANPTFDNAIGLPNAAFLSPFLSHTIALSDRRREPVSLLSIGVDRIDAIRKLHGPEFANEAIRKVGRIIAGTLRTSDLVACLDDGCLVAVLPGASVADALMVAESVRSAVDETGIASISLPLLTVSIGAATYPIHAADFTALRAAAVDALAIARSKGRNRVVAATAPPSDESTTLRVSALAD